MDEHGTLAPDDIYKLEEGFNFYDYLCHINDYKINF